MESYIYHNYGDSSSLYYSTGGYYYIAETPVVSISNKQHWRGYQYYDIMVNINVADPGRGLKNEFDYTFISNFYYNSDDGKYYVGDVDTLW